MQGCRMIVRPTPVRHILWPAPPSSMSLIHHQHRIRTFGHFPTPPWLHSIRRYSGVPGSLSDSSKVTSPTKHVPNVRRRFYEISVQEGFQGTYEEFSRQSHFHAYERAVKLGKFQGTYDAWRSEIAPNRVPGSTSNCFATPVSRDAL